MSDKKQRKNNSPQKIKKYRKPLNINIGMIFFTVIFIYIVVYVVAYMRTSHIVGYEVKEGSLSSQNIYRAISLRQEVLVPTQAAGYVNYYAREGDRLAVGDLVYTVDGTGKLKEQLQSISLGENSLKGDELTEFRTEIGTFVHGFQPWDFSSVYHFKYSLQGTVLRLANTYLMENIQSINGEGVEGVIDFSRAPQTGVVSYWYDGYESLTPDMVNEDILNEKKYERTLLTGTDLIASGDTAYKMCVSENWSIVLPIDEEKEAELAEENYVKVRFLKNQFESWGAVTILHNEDGHIYLKLDFTNSMVTFVSDRFLDVELLLHDETGLKIPNSSIVEREFYLVPAAFVTDTGKNGMGNLMKQVYLEDGTSSVEVVEAALYSLDEETGEYYLDTDMLERGTVLLRSDSQETYVVSKTATLIGVYNMNRGYADFRQIHILYQNDEYAIVESNTAYGLNVYDYIVLNADKVSDEQFIFEAK